MAHASQAQAAAGNEGAGGPAPGAAPGVPPRTPVEQAIAGFWAEALDRSDVGVFDDFFELDGDSLAAIEVIARIRETWGVSIQSMSFFEAPTVAALAAAVAAGAPSQRPVLGRRQPDTEPVLSFDQQRLWLEHQLRPESAYNVHGRLRLVGPLDVDALDASVAAILVRHEALRTRFPTVDGRPVQIVDDPDAGWHVGVADLDAVAGDRFDAARRLADEDAATPFDLARGPLFRCTLIKVSDTEHVLSITAHHIVCDDWSTGLFVRELSALYRVGGDLDRADLPALPVQYPDFAAWQRGWLTGEALERQVGYWRDHLAGAPSALTLPTAQWRAQSEKADGARIRSALSKQDTVALHELCRTYHVTSFMALLSSLATALARWSGQPDVVIGVPITGRTDAGTENLIGFFVNTLPLRVDLSGNPSFAGLLERVRETALSGYEYADAPLDLLVQQLQVTRVPGRTPLFQVVLNVVDDLGVEPLSGVSTQLLDAPAPPSKFDLVLTARESDGMLHLDLEYNADRYQESMIRILLDHVGTLLRSAMHNPTRAVLDYPLSPAGQVEPPPAGRRPAQRFAPDVVAVVGRDGEWTRRRLDRAAGRVAEILAGRRLAPPGHRLGVVRRPTASFVAAVLGCRLAGATYSVIDAAAGPAGRDGISTLLDVAPDGEVPDGTVDLGVLLREDGPTPAGADAVAGPPGPDGAAGPAGTDAAAGSPSRDWAVERFDLGAGDRFAVLSPRPAHLMAALSAAVDAGAAVLLAEHPFGDADALAGWLRANSVSVVYLQPPLLRALAARAAEPLPDLRYVFVDNSGDLLAHDVDLVRRLSPTCRCVAVYRVDRDGRPLAAYAVPEDWKLETAPLRVPLGTGVTGTPARLLHASGQAAAVGEVAEICEGDLRTGDLGRRWTDGTLEFVGRPADGQAVDALETVGTLREAPGVRDAVVTGHATADGHTVLYGYIAGPDPTGGASLAHQHLVTRLPDYLLPHHLFVLDRIPLTPGGEYDLGALPQPDADSAALDSYVAPRTPMERQLTAMLHELLDVDRIGVYDSFFELGGFSLLATRLASRIRDVFGVELSLRDLFASATVDQLARLVVQAQAELSGIDDLEALLDELTP